jgi:tRNA U34 5-carboxymethylaminomethyl modifying enzyme MnmG/GidA
LHYDIIVIGSGPAGKRAAIQASKIGKKVLLGLQFTRRIGRLVEGSACPTFCTALYIASRMAKGAANRGDE